MQLSVNGVSIYYEQHGVSGPQVLILHGWGCDSTLFRPITESLAQKMRVTVLDLPAHGKSGRPPEPWGVPEYAECVKAFTAAINLDACCVIAHSFGARIAIYLAGNHFAPFQKMILTGAAGLRRPPDKLQAQRQSAYRRLKALNETFGRIKPFHSLSQKLQSMLQQKYGSADYNALDDEMKKTFVKVVNQDLAEYLPSIDVPVLLIWGDQDEATPLWMGQQMEKEIPDAGLVVFSGGTHFAYLEQWPRFVTIAESFIMEE